ncbi:MAG TPA: tyrosine-type recombinase/integrase [Ktedonobacteraceae bacterium]|nr:tyrosine-type recombinase/integrase [Ktedonobacteraceae bacterium]
MCVVCSTSHLLYRQSNIRRGKLSRVISGRSLLKQVGLPRIRFHGLRHRTASLLLALDVHPKLVQELLGHSTISMTLDTYLHVLPSMLEDALVGLNTMLQV